MNENILEKLKELDARITKLESLNRDNEYQKIMTAKQQEENIFTKKHTWGRKNEVKR
jgi:hypothetical protein